jgi:hypothetical protein
VSAGGGSWWVSVKERWFARRLVKRLLESYAAVHASRPELAGVELYREVLLHSGAVDPAGVDRWLDDAEESVDEWTAPGRTGLGLREVAHFLVVSRYRDEGRPGAIVSFRAIVNALVAEHL